ncbi:MAG: hypothetical protein K0U37_05830 [Gammaproteobacteria bacterium]|nr:hypothetical protein [Gammaproteobacteria bacterium]
MFKKMYWMLGGASLFFSVGLYAMSCGGDGDCNKWAESSCACGVSARCNGITAQNKNGTCQCFGAEGKCDRGDDTDTYVAPGVRRVPVGRAPAGRAVRRGAVNGNVDVDVSR